ncbi:hypothetical protein L1987_83291 [Smallanthus sonchifolius]|uniref:Uncharacterized protein n=1 Tax=Smallanthus sonchifolius TaxID=185202 RepID=A0ACB8YB49_9ASTR|nr:hypothetical protein L1987_83291 [Smallanthus sonchifolius]
MKLLNHEMGNLSVQEYTDKFKVLAQLMPQKISLGLILSQFVQGLAPQSGERIEDERSECRRRMREKVKKGELEEHGKGNFHCARDVTITMREGVGHSVKIRTYQSNLPKVGVQPQTTEELWTHEAELRS